MENKKITLAVALIIIVGIGYFTYQSKQNSIYQPATNTPATTDSTQASGTSEVSGLPATSGITMQEVSAHSTRETCWSAINGGVYDLTSWIPQHPGGERPILSVCGKDGSSLFNKKHGGNAQIVTALAGFKIAVLAQ